tara:strand:+ start:1047 stop:1631 length:585 start_codon:yes stop_codon:yes gene_type:complete
MNNLDKKINELKKKKEKEKEDSKKRKEKEREIEKKENDFFKKNLSQYKKKLKDLVKLLSQDKDNIWKLSLRNLNYTFIINFETYGFDFRDHPFIDVSLKVYIDKYIKNKKHSYLEVQIYEGWNENSSYYPKYFTERFNPEDKKSYDLSAQNVWRTIFPDYRIKHKKFELNEAENAFNYFVDQIINFSKIDYSKL